MDNALTIEKFNLLPDSLKLQVSDYIEFLLNKYQNTEEELSQEVKDLLDERIKEYEENPTNVSSWEEVKQKFNTKHNYEL